MAWYDEFHARHAQAMAEAIAKSRAPLSGSLSDRSAQAVARAVAGPPVASEAFGKLIGRLSETADAIERLIAAQPLNRASPEHAAWEASLDAMRGDYETIARSLDLAATRTSGEVNPASTFQAGAVEDSLRGTIGPQLSPPKRAKGSSVGGPEWKQRVAAARERLRSKRNPFRELEQQIEQEILSAASPLMRGDGTIEVSQFGALTSPKLQELLSNPDAGNALLGLAAKYGIQGADDLQGQLIRRIVSDAQSRALKQASAGGARTSISGRARRSSVGGGPTPARPQFEEPRTLIDRRTGAVVRSRSLADDIPLMEGLIPVAVTRNVARPAVVINPATGTPKVDELGLPLERGSRTAQETGVFAGRTYTDENGNVVTEPDLDRPLIELVRSRTGGDGNRSPESVVWLLPRDDGSYQVLSIDPQTGGPAAPTLANAADVDRLLREGFEPTTAGDKKPQSILADKQPGAIGRMALEASKSDVDPASLAMMLSELRAWRTLGSKGDMDTLLREAGAGDPALGQQRVSELLSRAIDITTEGDVRRAAKSIQPLRVIGEETAADDAARRAEALASRTRRAVEESGVVSAQSPVLSPDGGLSFSPLDSESILAGLAPQSVVDIASAGIAPPSVRARGPGGRFGGNVPVTTSADVTSGVDADVVSARPGLFRREGLVVDSDGVARLAGQNPAGGGQLTTGTPVDSDLLQQFADQIGLPRPQAPSPATAPDGSAFVGPDGTASFTLGGDITASDLIDRFADGEPFSAVWSGPQFDYPVTVVGRPELAQDGRAYVRVEYGGQQSYVPLDQLRSGDASSTSPLDALLYGRQSTPAGQMAFNVTDGSWAAGVTGGRPPAAANLARAVQSGSVGDYLGNPIEVSATMSSPLSVEPDVISASGPAGPGRQVDGWSQNFVEPVLRGTPGQSSISVGASNVRTAMDAMERARQARMARGDRADARVMERERSRAAVAAGQDVPAVDDPALRAEADASFRDVDPTMQVINQSRLPGREPKPIPMKVLRDLFASTFGRPGGESGTRRVRYPVGLGNYDARMPSERVGQAQVERLAEDQQRLFELDEEIEGLRSRVQKPGPAVGPEEIDALNSRIEELTANRDALQTEIDASIESFAADNNVAIESAGTNQAKLVDAFMTAQKPSDRMQALRGLLGTNRETPATAMDGIRRAAAAAGMPEPSDADIIYSILMHNRDASGLIEADTLYQAAIKASDDLASVYDRRPGSAAANAAQPKVGEYGAAKRILQRLMGLLTPNDAPSAAGPDPAGALDPLFRRLPIPVPYRPGFYEPGLIAQAIRRMTPDQARQALSDVESVAAQVDSIAGEGFGPAAPDYAQSLRSAIEEARSATRSVLNPSGVSQVQPFRTEAQVELAEVNARLDELMRASPVRDDSGQITGYTPAALREDYDPAEIQQLMDRREQLLSEVPNDSPEALAAKEFEKPAAPPLESRPATVRPDTLPRRSQRSSDEIMTELASVQRELDGLKAESARSRIALPGGREIDTSRGRGMDGGGPDEYRTELARRARELTEELSLAGRTATPEELAAFGRGSQAADRKPAIPAGQIDFSVLLGRNEAERMRALVSNPTAHLLEDVDRQIERLRTAPDGSAEELQALMQRRALLQKGPSEFIGQPTFEVRDLPGGKAEITMRRRVRLDGALMEPEHTFVGEIADRGARRNDRFTVSFADEDGAVKPTVLAPEWVRKTSEDAAFDATPVVRPSRQAPQAQQPAPAQAQPASQPQGPQPSRPAGPEQAQPTRTPEAEAEDAAAAADLEVAREAGRQARQRERAAAKESEIEAANREPIDFTEVLDEQPAPRTPAADDDPKGSLVGRVARKAAKTAGYGGAAYMLADLGQRAGYLPTSGDVAAVAGIVGGNQLMAAPLTGAIMADGQAPEDTNQEASRVVDRIRQARRSPYYTVGNILPY